MNCASVRLIAWNKRCSVQWPTIQYANIPDGFSTSWLRNGMYEIPDMLGQSWLEEGVRLWMSRLFVQGTFLFHRMSKKYPPMFSASSPQVLRIRSSGLGLLMWSRDFHPLPLRVMRPTAIPSHRSCEMRAVRGQLGWTDPVRLQVVSPAAIPSHRSCERRAVRGQPVCTDQFTERGTSSVLRVYDSSP